MAKYIVIGGVAGGATAAGRLRRLDKEAEIIMLERGKHISFANCGLPYYIGGLVEDKTQLLATTPEKFSEFYHIDVRVENEALSIDTEQQILTIKNHQTGETYQETYDKLLLSMGAAPIDAPFADTKTKGVFRLRSYADTLEIKEYIDTYHPKKAVVVGSGFIGLEMVENFHRNGIHVSLIQRGDKIFAPIDDDMSQPIKDTLEQHGVDVYLNANVSSVKEENGTLMVQTAEGDSLEADMVLLSLGVRPESDIAVAAGIKTGLKNGIVVNQRMETSAKNVYAIGDAVQVNHIVSGQPTLIALAGPAQQQARVAAANMTGGVATYKGSLGSSVLQIFDVTVANTGLNSGQAAQAGLHYDSVIVSSISNAGYYPGWEEFTMKVIYEENTGRILGGQVVGGKGVDKRGDALAVAITAGMTAYDLEDLQICYAPPFAIPREAINIAGSLIVGEIEKNRK